MKKKNILGFIAWMVMGLGLYYAGKKTSQYKDKWALEKQQIEANFTDKSKTQNGN